MKKTDWHKVTAWKEVKTIGVLTVWHVPGMNVVIRAVVRRPLSQGLKGKELTRHTNPCQTKK